MTLTLGLRLILNLEMGNNYETILIFDFDF